MLQVLFFKIFELSKTFFYIIIVKNNKQGGKYYKDSNINNDCTKDIGYGLWDNIDKVWNSAATLEPMPNFTPKAWMIYTDLIPAEM